MITTKKIANLALASSLLVAGVVAANPHQAHAAINAESLVVKAEKNISILRHAISVDYKADLKTQPWTQYNKAKTDYNTAKSAVSKLSSKDRTRLNARLDAVKVWIDRTAVYIDAITSGKKLVSLQGELEKNMTTANLKEMRESYDKLSYEIKKQAAYLYKVYGKSTRDAMLKKYEAPAAAAKNKALYPVSVFIEIGRVASALEADNETLATKYAQNIYTWMPKIDSYSLRTALSMYYLDQIGPYLDKSEPIASIKPYENFVFHTNDPDITAYDPFGFYNEDGDEIYEDAYEQGIIVKDEKGYFDEEGYLVPAFENTGITQAGTDKITFIDTNNNNKVLAEAEITITDDQGTK